MPSLSQLLNRLPSRLPVVADIAIGVGCTATGILFRWALDPLLGQFIPWVTFFPVVLLASLVGGGLAAGITLGLCGVLGEFLFVQPRYTLGVTSPSDFFSLTSFLLASTLIASVGLTLRQTLRTLRQRSEEVSATSRALHESEQRLRSFADASPAALGASDENGRLIFISRTWRELTGMSEEESLGFGWRVAVHPDDLEPTLAASAAARAQRVPFQTDYRLRRPDGSYGWVMVIGRPRIEPDGRFAGFAWSVSEISDRKEAERTLRQHEEKLLTQVDELTQLHEFGTRIVGTRELEPLLREVLAAVIALQPADRGFIELYDDGKNRLIPGVAVGHDPELFHQLASTPIGEGNGACGTAAARRSRVIIEDVEIDPLFQDLREQARQAGFRAVWSTPLLTSRGELVGVLSTHYPSPYRPSGRLIQLVELYARLAADAIEAATLVARMQEAQRDSERSLLALRDADQRKDEFLAMLAHELRNPLAPIRNAVAVLQTIRSDDRHLGQAREIIERQVTHMTRLIDDLLEVSRITRGKIGLERKPVRLAEVIEAAIETARPAIDRKHHTLSLHHHAEATLDGDRERLVQVVANLLSNAAKFTPPNGRIEIETDVEAGETAVIRVRDNGVGIAPEMHQRVFDLFAQEESTLARSQGGLGIGLTLVKLLVELHGGEVKIRSDGRDRGTEITVALPILTAQLPEDAVRPRTEIDRRGDGLRVMIVEDNADTAESFRVLLELHGHQVRVAHHGDQALRIIDEFRPQISFIDLGLPEMTGFELGRQLRAHPRTKDTVLVALTGYSRAEDKEKTQAVGFDRHLTKPVDPKVVLELLASLPVDAKEAADRPSLIPLA